MYTHVIFAVFHHCLTCVHTTHNKTQTFMYKLYMLEFFTWNRIFSYKCNLNKICWRIRTPTVFNLFEVTAVRAAIFRSKKIKISKNLSVNALGGCVGKNLRKSEIFRDNKVHFATPSDDKKREGRIGENNFP